MTNGPFNLVLPEVQLWMHIGFQEILLALTYTVETPVKDELLTNEQKTI